MPSYLIDTNVMLAASAVFDSLSRLAEEAEPKEIEFRELIFKWLSEFADSENKILLDEENLIRDEYDKKMRFNCAMQAQEYGNQVLQSKLDNNLYDLVPIDDIVESASDRIALLSPELTAIVTDPDDRKWVAASRSALDYLEETCPIVYGAESDWYPLEAPLSPYNITFCRLLPIAWYTSRHGGGKW
jgi:hypothetical protein